MFAPVRQKTKLEILHETYEYYCADPNERRAIDFVDLPARPVCAYYNKDGKTCAVGRCLSNPNQFYRVYISANDLLSSNGDKILKEEYRGHGQDFYSDLQRFHDKRIFWDNERNFISSKGNEFFHKLVEKYRNG